MDILAANDQENVVRNLQAGPAGKALHAGLKGFNAKTPGNKAPKTPFKIPLNDENAVQKAGKSVLQIKPSGSENLLKTTQKDGKPDANAFMTPAGPRSRAPLGMKTTNAKAKAFQTPAPLTGSVKTQKASPRLRRPKVKVHQPEPETEEKDVPEIEYMPPKEIPLPEDMGEYLPREWKLPVLDNNNTIRGIFDVYHNPIEDDGRTRIERKWEESLERDRKMQELEDERFAEMWEKETAEAARYFSGETSKKDAPKPAVKPAETKRKATGPTTLKARSAASALSGAPKPSFAAPTAAAAARLPRAPLANKKSIKPAMAPSATRHATATAASKSTIGYAQGRTTNTNTTPRKPLSNVTKPALFSATSAQPAIFSSLHGRNVSNSSVGAKTRGAFSRSSSTSTNATLVAQSQEEYFRTAEEVEREIEAMFLQGSDDEDVDAWANSFANQLGGADPFDEDLEDFQLQLPEGL